MRRLGFCILLGWAAAVQAEGIADVLQRSQAARLAQRGAANPHSVAAQRVRHSFSRLIALLAPSPDEPAALLLVAGPLFAEAVFGGRAVVVSESVGDLPEGERLLMLAHELGHVTLGHWAGLSALYQQHIPGDVLPETTDPVAGVLGPQAHALSHRHEFEADAFGFTLVRRLGYGVDNAFGLLSRNGVQLDSATHPATRRRLAQMRLLDTQLDDAPRRVGPATELAASPAAGDRR